MKLSSRCRALLAQLLAVISLMLSAAPSDASQSSSQQEDVLFPSEFEEEPKAGGAGLGGLLDIIEIVVTPAKKEQTIEQAPSIISVIKASDIEENGHRSVAEALRQVPGVYVRDDLVHPNVSMRGVDPGLRGWSRNVKVMINGQPISYRSDTANWIGPELIPMDAISRIEVVRGPGSTLYGANAFLGVINIITRDGFETEWSRASVESGVLLNPCPSGNEKVMYNGQRVNLCSAAPTELNPVFRASLAFGRKLELNSNTRLNFLAAGSVGYTDRTGLMLPSSSPHFNSTGPRYFKGSDADVTSSGDEDMWATAFAHADLLNDTLGKIMIEGSYSEFARDGEFTDWSVLTHENRIGMRNWYVLIGQEKKFQGVPLTYRLRLSLAGGGNTGRNHLQIAQDNTYWVKKVGGYLGFDASTELSYEVTPKVTLITGATLTEDFHDLPSIYSVDNTTADGATGAPAQVPSYLRGNVRFQNIAVFGQGLYTPIDTLSLIAGISYEDHNVYGRCTWDSCPGLNARLGGSYSIIKSSEASLYAKLLYGSSFKAPPAELLYGTPYVVSGISGNLDLKPEVAHTFEAAIGSGILLAQRRVRLDLLVNGFLNLVNGKAEYVQVGNFLQAANSSNLETIGVEGSIKAQYQKDASAYVNISWQHTAVADCLLGDEAICQKQAEFNPLYPAMVLSFGAAYRIPRIHLRASLYGNLIGSRWASQSNRAENLPSTAGSGSDSKAYSLPTYTLLNLMISTMDLKVFAERETLFTLGFYNLLNSGIVEPGFNGIDTPSLGLSVLAGVRQSI